MRDSAPRRIMSRAWAKCLVAAGRLRRTRHKFGVSQLAWISPCRRQGSDLWGSDISPKALGPTDGLSAVLGRNALKEPGDCDAARQATNDTEPHESQDAQLIKRFECPALVDLSQGHHTGLWRNKSMFEPLKMAERLLAHAKMCHEVASECGDEKLAADFNKLALECIEAAAACKQQPKLH